MTPSLATLDTFQHAFTVKLQNLKKNENILVTISNTIQLEASKIMKKASASGLTSSNYLWMVTQSVVGDPDELRSTRNDLPTGMLGTAYYTDLGSRCRV